MGVRTASGGVPRVAIRIFRRRPEESFNHNRLREDLNYVVSKRGIELRADLRLANASSGHQQLDVALPANWRVIEAAVGDQQLTWHTTAAEKAADPARVTIQLPDDPKNRPTTVRLRAWRSHSVGELLRLPMLAVNDAFWTSGNIQLTLDDSLELNKLAPVDCVQSAADSDGNAGEVPSELGGSLSFAAFTPSAAVEVALTHRPVAGHVAMGTTLDVGNPNVAGRLVADVSVERGTLHQLRADLQPGWTIDAVETVPATALGEWYVDREDQPQAFELQLNRAVTPNQPVRVVITGRLERPASLEPLPLIELNPLSWRGLLVSRNLLQLRAAEQFDLEPAGDLQYLEASGLTAPERTLLTDPLAGRICDSAANRPDSAIRLAPKKGDLRRDRSARLRLVPRSFAANLSRRVSPAWQWDRSCPGLSFGACAGAAPLDRSSFERAARCPADATERSTTAWAPAGRRTLAARLAPLVRPQHLAVRNLVLAVD